MKLSEQEKSQLRNRISHSISNYIQRKRILKYSLGVASILLIALFSTNIFKTENRPISTINSVAKSLEHQQVSDEVQLVLSNNESIDIEGNDASIYYSKNGQKVTLGNSKYIHQNASEESDGNFNTLIVPYGKRSSIVLSDGSKIWLNSGSKLVFPAKFLGNGREVYLEGEAIFEVFHDKKRPFKVKLGQQDIEVLGTVFNVSNYVDDESITTVLKSGSVKINRNTDLKSNRSNSIVITPGTKAAFHKENNRLETKEVEVEKYFSWRDGVFIFKNDSMQSIMKKIARYYNIEIIINNKELAQTTFSGYLDVKDNVQNVMKTIKQTTKFDYVLNDKQLIIN